MNESWTDGLLDERVARGTFQSRRCAPFGSLSPLLPFPRGRSACELVPNAYVFTAFGNSAIISMSPCKQDLTHHATCSVRSKMLRARRWQGVFRYQAIKCRRGVSFGRIGGPANPAGLHLIDGRLLQPGLGPAIRQRNAPIDSGVF
jgi:hypothetical protein